MSSPAACGRCLQGQGALDLAYEGPPRGAGSSPRIRRRRRGSRHGCPCHRYSAYLLESTSGKCSPRRQSVRDNERMTRHLMLEFDGGETAFVKRMVPPVRRRARGLCAGLRQQGVRHTIPSELIPHRRVWSVTNPYPARSSSVTCRCISPDGAHPGLCAQRQPPEPGGTKVCGGLHRAWLPTNRPEGQGREIGAD